MIIDIPVIKAQSQTNAPKGMPITNPTIVKSKIKEMTININWNIPAKYLPPIKLPNPGRIKIFNNKPITALILDLAIK